jgi:hypothetical protein
MHRSIDRGSTEVNIGCDDFQRGEEQATMESSKTQLRDHAIVKPEEIVEPIQGLTN